MKSLTMNSFLLLAVLFAVNVSAGQSMPMMQISDANPCSMKHQNPCSMKHQNPCGMKKGGMKKGDMKMHNPCNMEKGSMEMHNPCNMPHKNPCENKASDQIDAKLIKRPAGVAQYAGASRSQLVRDGERLFRDSSLSPNKTTCNDCHSTDDLFKPGFAKPYPHPVSMAKQRAGVSGSLQADEFVQFCMLAPMASKTLPWESRELAALAAYVIDVKQKNFRVAMNNNPCSMKHKNPCSMKGGMDMHNPCSMKHKNPCSMKEGMKGDMKMHNPCNMKHDNPCSMQHKNPCSKQHNNPCNM